MTLSGTLWAAALLASGTYTPPNHHRVLQGESFASISRHYGVGYQRLVTANPAFVPERVRPGTVILIPGRIREPESRPVAQAGRYRVVNGDTDWSIARRFDLKPSQLRALNPGVNWRTLAIGTSLQVPNRTATVARANPARPTAQTVAKTPVGPTVRHTVRPGENDWIIARGYGTTPSRIRALNPGVNWTAMRPGTVLTVPKGTGSSQVARITTKRARVVRDNVIVRSGARQDSARVAMVDQGRIASVADRIGDWYKLRFTTGTVGWVRGDLLKPVSAAELVASATARPSSPTRRRIVNDERPTRVASRTTRSSATPRTLRRGSLPTMRPEVAGSLVGTALSNLGVRYRWGGTSRSGFDCSGFTTYVFRQHGKSLPRTSIEQSRVGASVSRGELKEGDLVFFKTRSSRVSHVGIYKGNGKFVHASSGSGRVRVNSLNDRYYAARYAGARRVTPTKVARPSRPAPEQRAKVEPQSRAPETSASIDPAPVAEPRSAPVTTDAVGR